MSICRSSADAAEDLMLWTSGLPYGLASLDERLAYIETSRNDDPRTVKLMQEVCDLLKPHKKAEAPRANGDPALSAILRGVVGSDESGGAVLNPDDAIRPRTFSRRREGRVPRPHTLHCIASLWSNRTGLWSSTL
jgi:hypothetical protein